MNAPVIRDPFFKGDDGGWSRQRVVFLATSLVLFIALVAWTSDVLLPFILALVIAYVLTPLVALCERIKIPRSLSIIIVYLVTIGSIYIFVAATAPRIYQETMKLARDAPALLRDVTTTWGPRIDKWIQGVLGRAEPMRAASPARPPPAIEIVRQPDGSYGLHLRTGFDVVQESPRRWRVVPQSADGLEGPFSVTELASEGVDRFLGYLKRNAIEVIKFGQTVVTKVARAIFLLFMTLMVAGYVMHTREHLMGFFRSLPPPRARLSFDRLLWRMDRGLSGVVRGQLLICLVNGLLSAIGFWMFGLKYWPILSIISAVMSLIPIFGSILSTIPAVLIGLTQNFWTALWVLLWVIGVHQIEANLLNPKIIGVAARIHPVLVVFALLVGEHFYGLWGALLAVPAVSLVQSLFNHFRFEAMPDSMPDSLLPPDVASSRSPR